MPGQPPDQTQPPESIVLARFDGLKNTVKRERMGLRDLARAVNIDLDDGGQVHRRRGFTKVRSGEHHSLFQDNAGTVYGVSEGDLGVINVDYSFDLLRNSVGGSAQLGNYGLAYAQVGPQVYFTCSTDAGIIDTPSKVVSDWGDSQDIWLSPVVNPTATLPDVRGKLLGRPPFATTLAYFNGRLYLGQGRTVWATELYLYRYVDKTRNFLPFEGEVTMIGSVSDGLYVGTDEGCYFLDGSTFPPKRVRVMDSPVLPGSMCYIPSELANPPQVPSDADTPVTVSVGFMTTAGFCVGAESGKVLNLTESRVFFPRARAAASVFRRQDGFSQYLVVANHGGDPKGGAAIGDYVDAQIVRGRDKWVQRSEGYQISEQFRPTWI